MMIKLFILSLAFLHISAKCEETKEVDDLTAWLNVILEPNADLTPTHVDTSTNTRTCKTENDKDGICVRKSQCKPDPTTAFILRERDACHRLETCCAEENVRDTIVAAVSPKNREGCGWSNPGANGNRENVNGRTTGLAEFGEFPWMIAVINRRVSEVKNWEEKYVAGGALIHPRVVITAAHKVHDYATYELKARAGEYDTRSVTEIEPYQEKDVVRIIKHDKYFDVQAHYNVALLILTSAFDLMEAPHIGVACLALHLPPPNTRCYSMGWGQDFLNEDKYSVILKKVEVPLVEPSICEHQYRNTKIGSRFSLHRTLTCGGGEEGVDTCKGDGGSPLVCPIPGQPQRYQVVGLVTYGLGCGTKIPAVYVKIPELYDWVGDQLTVIGINKTSFEFK